MLVQEVLREDKVEHDTEFFLITQKTSLKKAASKPQGSILLLSGQFLGFKCE